MLKEIVDGARGHQNGGDGTFQDGTFEIIRSFSRIVHLSFLFDLLFWGDLRTQQKMGKYQAMENKLKEDQQEGGQGKVRQLHRQQV